MAKGLKKLYGKIHQGDCIKGLEKVPGGSVDLAFADPPFNIGYKYDEYDDRLGDEHYIDWSHQWMAQVHRVLKDDGTFWLAIGDEYAAELKVEAQKIGFHCRSWVIWYYTFGVNCKKKFTRSHAHLFHFVKDKKNFTFNHDDLDLRVPSARRLIYNDKRANPNGRMPDDAWILRPQELVNGFDPDEDVWHFPRVAGTFKERAGFHGCQMPEQLLGRIIRSCSREDEIVIDPFSGSSTTLAVAKKLGREFFGFELSKEYARLGKERLDSITAGDRLVGAEEPNMTNILAKDKLAAKAKNKKTGKNKSKVAREQLTLFPAEDLIHNEIAAQLDGVVEAFANSNQAHSVERVIADPVLNENFQTACERLSIPGTEAERNRFLFRVRKDGLLKAALVRTDLKTKISWKDIRAFVFASEIAWRQISNKYSMTLDEMFCDPRIASQFDEIAAGFAPGFQPLDYRWAALKLRKEASVARKRAKRFSAKEFGIKNLAAKSLKPGQGKRIDGLDFDSIPTTAGAYLIRDLDGEVLYAGETDNLASRIATKFADEAPRSLWLRRSADLELFLSSVAKIEPDQQLARQSLLLKWHKPQWNSVKELSA